MRKTLPASVALVALLALGGCGKSGCGGPARQRGGISPPTQEHRDAEARSATPVLEAPVTSSDGSQTRPARTAFVPPAAPTGWRHNSTYVHVATQGDPNHRGQDVVAVAGTAQLLIGKFAYGLLDKDLKDEEVDIYFQKAPPLGPWELLGTALTSEDGQHGSRYGIEDDGGRIFFTIPPKASLPVGRYPVQMLVKGDHSIAEFTLFVVPPNTSTVVFDIDGTLTTDDVELMAQLLSKLRTGGYVPMIRSGAASVARAWADKGYLPLYLTGRPDMLRSLTKDWLVRMRLPPGPIQLTDTNSQALPSSGGVGQFKTDVLTRMTHQVSLHLYAAYGNARTDIQAYLGAGIPKDRIFIIGPNGGMQGTTAIASYESHLADVEQMPPATVPAPPASFGW